MQPKPLITLDDVLLQYCSSGRIVTANERLATALLDSFERRVRGDVDLPAPQVSTLDEYLRERLAQLPPNRSRTLLSAEAQRFVWLELTPELPDVDFDALYARVADAWRVMYDWQLSSLLDQFDDNENHRLFRDWAQLYLRAARQRGWITESEIPAAIELAVREGTLVAEPLLLLGFDVVPPSVERVLDAYRSAGATILHFEPAHPNSARVVTASCADADQELRAAIHWAKSALAEAQEPVSICVAVPNLVESHDRVVRQLDAILRPEDADPSAATSPYNVSGGVPLGAVPVVADALDFLDWLFQPFHHARIDALLRSPFLQLGRASATDGERLPEWSDAARYAGLTRHSPLRDIVRQASIVGLLDLKDAVASARHLLSLAGWPDSSRLSSESYQAYSSFEALFDELAANSTFAQPRHFAATISQLRLAANRRLFAPERPRAAIQVLGYLETIGLEFTHLWVTGLNQLDWPGSPSPTPFIPMRHLRAASVSRSDVGGEVAFARRLMAHWRAAAGALALSHPLVRNDVPCRGSALLQELDPIEAFEIVGPELALSHPYVVGHIALSQYENLEVGPLDAKRLRHRGTGIIRDQSACPFRAFARYRLHAPQHTTPHSFPNMTDRGVAVHLALRRLFDGVMAKENGAPDEALFAAASESATAAVATLGQQPSLFRASEHARILTLLLEWLALERKRPPHRIIGNETSKNLTIGGITFDLRIDRIDESADGELLVMDYKTGPTNPNAVMGPRPEEPQLPMYALSTPGVAAVAFALVRTNECRLIGWSDRTFSTTQNTEQVRFNSAGDGTGSWSRVLEDWRASLANLATEFRTGVAHVQPRDAAACDECNLHALCRIREIRP